MPTPAGEFSHWKVLGGGAAAGLAGSLVSCPSEHIRTKMQLQRRAQLAAAMGLKIQASSACLPTRLACSPVDVGWPGSDHAVALRLSTWHACCMHTKTPNGCPACTLPSSRSLPSSAAHPAGVVFH